MIDFDEELAKFRPAPELDDAEKIIREGVTADLMDLLAEIGNARRETSGSQEN